MGLGFFGSSSDSSATQANQQNTVTPAGAASPTLLASGTKSSAVSTAGAPVYTLGSKASLTINYDSPSANAPNAVVTPTTPPASTLGDNGSLDAFAGALFGSSQLATQTAGGNGTSPTITTGQPSDFLSSLSTNSIVAVIIGIVVLFILFRKK